MSEQQPRPNLSNDEAYLARARDMIKGKGELEDIHFEYLTNVLAALGISTNIYENVSSVTIPEEVGSTISDAYDTLQSLQPEAEVAQKLYQLWDYLAESDPLGKADLIYVFGGISELAVLEAIRLKNEKYAPKILFSGKHGSYMKEVTSLSEAEKYAQLACAQGVSSEDIILERESINIVENVVNSSKLLHELHYIPKSIIAVSLPYHMKRASLTLRAGMDIDFKLIRHPGPSA